VVVGLERFGEDGWEGEGVRERFGAIFVLVGV